MANKHTVFDVIITFVIWFYFGITALLSVPFVPILMLFGIISGSQIKTFSFFIRNYIRLLLNLLCLLLPGLSYKFPDKKILKKINGAIIISNHPSTLDGILMISLLKNAVVFIKSSYFKIPVLGWFFHWAGYIPIFSGTEMDNIAIKRMQSMQKNALKGINFIIFPEGSRSRDGKIADFQMGAFKFAKRMNLPVYVFYLNNVSLFFPLNSLLLNRKTRGKVKIKYLGTVLPDKDLKSIRLESRIILLKANGEI